MNIYIVCIFLINNRYAMKQMKKNRFESGDINGLLNEIDLLKQLDHPNCIKLYETYEDNRKIYLIMEVLFIYVINYFFIGVYRWRII